MPTVPRVLERTRLQRVAVWVMLCCLAGAASAQTRGRLENRQVSPGGGYYFNAQPGEITTQISVWGAVARPGIYEVGQGFSLQSVVSMAGGPSPLMGTDQNLQLRMTVYRQSQVVYESTVEELALQVEASPGLLDGDIVEIRPDRTVRVNVWGTVREPGLVVLGPSDTVRSALSLAGGPVLAALRDNVDRDVQLLISRADGTVAYAGPLDELPQSVNQQPLSDGDVLSVEVRERIGWELRDTITVVGVVISSVVAVTQIIRLLDTN